MNKEIRLNAFDMNCVGHIQHGMWTHPRDRSTEYNTIRYWQDLARLAERGKSDGIFLAHIVDVYQGSAQPCSRAESAMVGLPGRNKLKAISAMPHSVA